MKFIETDTEHKFLVMGEKQLSGTDEQIKASIAFYKHIFTSDSVLQKDGIYYFCQFIPIAKFEDMVPQIVSASVT